MKWKLLLAVVVLFSAVLPVSADSVAIFSVSNDTGDTLGNPPFTLGYQFNLLTDSTVSALGIFDSGQDGLLESHAVGIWNSTGTLLASTVVSTGDVLINKFRYAFVSPLLLEVGTYRVGAVYESGADPVIFNASSITASPYTTFGVRTYQGGSFLSDPIVPFGPDLGFFGPNALIDPVPTPSALAALLGMGAVGLIGVARRRRKIA